MPLARPLLAPLRFAAGVDIALIGVPYDAGANHPGTRLGPREIRNKSSVVRRRVRPTGKALPLLRALR